MTTTPRTWYAVITAGPDAGRRVPLDAGQIVIGRSPDAGIAIQDDALEPHHALALVSGADVALTQLAGRIPIRVAGDLVDGGTAVAEHSSVELGATRLHFARLADAESSWPADHTAVVRTPRIPPPEPHAHVLVPVDGDGHSVGPGIGTLVASIVSGVGAVALAVAVGQPMFAIFGLFGAVAGLATWMTGRLGGRRARRRAVRERAQRVQQFHEDLEVAHLQLRHQHLIAAGIDPVAVPWLRRASHGDAFRVVLGEGKIRLPPTLLDRAGEPVGIEQLATDLQPVVDNQSVIPDVPVVADLGAAATEIVAIVGRDAMSVVRSVLVQLARQSGPADWRLASALADADAGTMSWLRRIPHLVRFDDADDTGSDETVIADDDPECLARRIARLDDGDRRRLVVLADRATLLTVRTSPLRRLIAAVDRLTVLAVLGDDEPVPAVCTASLDLRPRWRGVWSPRLHTPNSVEQRLHVAGSSFDTTAEQLSSLTSLIDPEDPSLARDALPSTITLADAGLVPASTEMLVEHWSRLGADPPPLVRIGSSGDAWLDLDLARDGPHALVAGTTGSGKSELLKTLVVGLALGQTPLDLTFVLIDYKGGSTFDACAGLPHLVGVVTDLDGDLGARALVSLEAEVRRRERLLRAVGAADLGAYRASGAEEPLPRLVVVVDEFAALAAELPEFLSSLVGVAQRGRSLGIHLVLATQRPTGVVSDDIRANTNLRIALRLPDVSDAIDVVADPSPATLPRGVPGRAVVRLGPAELVSFQSVTTSSPPGELERIVAMSKAAARELDAIDSHRPWVPPLPDRLTAADRPSGAAGLIDRPDLQAREPLCWSPDKGHLLVIGSATSETGSMITAAVIAAVEVHDLTVVYGIDASGTGELSSLLELGACPAVVNVHERERLDRLLDRLRADIRQRRSTPIDPAAPYTICVIHGLHAVRSVLDAPDRDDARAALSELLDDGPTARVAVVAAMPPSHGGSGVVSRFGSRWVGHLDDPVDGPALGVPVARVAGRLAGRVVVPPACHVAQVAELSVADLPPARRTARNHVPPPVATLPTEVPHSSLPASDRASEDGSALVVGLDAATLEPARIDIPVGDHVLVLGPSRAGRSTALAQLLAAWSIAHPAGALAVVCGSPRSPLAGHDATVGGVDELRFGGSPDATPALVVVDDAERVEDSAGVLVGLMESGTTVFASGRADALRASFGHWTSVVRRSRCGLVMASSGDLDGDLLGVMLPRRCPIPPRPGLAWLVDSGGHRLVQVAC